MEAAIENVVQRIHDATVMATIAVAGAGNQALVWVLGVAGASRTVLEITVPYAASSFAGYIGHEPDQIVSLETSRQLARAAYNRALRLRQNADPVVGIACTATIATDRTKRGEHRCHVSAWSSDGVVSYSLRLVKGERDRAEEDRIVSLLVLQALAEAASVKFDLEIDLLPEEEVEIDTRRYRDSLGALYSAHVGSVVVEPGGEQSADVPVADAILSGSFNPLHEAHINLAQAASHLLGCDVAFELSIANVDKPALEEGVVRSRVAQFEDKCTVVVTAAPVFYEKARLFPGCTFVIGWDTAVRLVDPKYYHDKFSSMIIALDEISSLGCRFLVAGRVDGDRFRTLDEIDVPVDFADLFSTLPESRFRYDLSSTELRLAGKGNRTP